MMQINNPDQQEWRPASKAMTAADLDEQEITGTAFQVFRRQNFATKELLTKRECY
ncbi:hypothetical protein [Bradyrhizobium sp.]|uniref:hypothetical protein n=1 Tax=Bradyrhizobium sp. TaxID=376 RepID=UPI0039E39A24